MAITFRSLISSRTPLFRLLMDGNRRDLRYFSDNKGPVFSEEERAAENIYIKKMEKEKMENQKAEKEKEKCEKKAEGETRKN